MKSKSKFVSESKIIIKKYNNQVLFLMIDEQKIMTDFIRLLKRT